MAAALKKLASQTAIYGLPSMVGRFLNYLLVPLYTGTFVAAQYGVISDIYAIVAFVAVVLPFGMETAFFRFSNRDGVDKDKVLSTSTTFVLFAGLAFIISTVLFSQEIATWLLYPDNPEYIVWMGVAVGLDALAAIPLARLRRDEKPVPFALINTGNIAVNLLANLFFIYYCMPLVESGQSNWLTDTFYDPSIGIGYVFISNLLASSFRFLCVLPSYFKVGVTLDRELASRMLRYGAPLMVAGIAGIVNETLDRRLIRLILEPIYGTDYALSQVGIYSACYKLAVVIALFNQAFRYAVEPFFFAQEKEVGSRQVYARVMTAYTWITSLIIAGVILYIDFFKYFIRTEEYWSGLHIVPILLFANLFLGWYYNLSVWYKLNEQTRFGMYFSIFGALVTIGVNLVLIPKIGYTGSAWATFAAYGSMVLLSFVFGRLRNPMPYEFVKVVSYPLLAFAAILIQSHFQLDVLSSSVVMFGLLILFLLGEKKGILSYIRNR